MASPTLAPSALPSTPSPRLRWRRPSVVAVLSWTLLFLQCLIPWTGARFATQDGPSHLYNGVIARSLLLHGSASPYAHIYAFQPKFIPNWGITALFAVASVIVGQEHAEQAIATALILIGFVAFAYAVRSLAPRVSPWSPLANALLVSYFYFKGFYNFYLGTTLILAIAGYYIRRSSALTTRRAAALCAFLIGLSLVHLLPAIIALFAVTTLALWFHVVSPFCLAPAPRPRWTATIRPLAVIALALVPPSLLILSYMRGSESLPYNNDLAQALREFPMHAFVATTGRVGRLELAIPVLILVLVAGLVSLRRREWAGPRGGAAAVILVVLGLYLFVPDIGYGGGEAKARLAWTLLLFGGVLAASLPRLRAFLALAGVFLAMLVFGALSDARFVNERSNALAAEYLNVLKVIPPGANIVRIRYPIPKARARYGVPDDLASDPLWHLESLAATRQRLVNLSDYEAFTLTFPLMVRPDVLSHVQHWHSYALEESYTEGPGHLGEILKGYPIHVDYYVVLGELTAPDAPTMPKVLSMLEASGATLIATAGPEPFVRIYRAPAAASSSAATPGL